MPTTTRTIPKARAHHLTISTVTKRLNAKLMSSANFSSIAALLKKKVIKYDDSNKVKN